MIFYIIIIKGDEMIETRKKEVYYNLTSEYKINSYEDIGAALQ